MDDIEDGIEWDDFAVPSLTENSVLEAHNQDHSAVTEGSECISNSMKTLPGPKMTTILWDPTKTHYEIPKDMRINNWLEENFKTDNEGGQEDESNISETCINYLKDGEYQNNANAHQVISTQNLNTKLLETDFDEDFDFESKGIEDFNTLPKLFQKKNVEVLENYTEQSGWITPNYLRNLSPTLKKRLLSSPTPSSSASMICSESDEEGFDDIEFPSTIDDTTFESLRQNKLNQIDKEVTNTNEDLELENFLEDLIIPEKLELKDLDLNKFKTSKENEEANFKAVNSHDYGAEGRFEDFDQTDLDYLDFGEDVDCSPFDKSFLIEKKELKDNSKTLLDSSLNESDVITDNIISPLNNHFINSNSNSTSVADILELFSVNGENNTVIEELPQKVEEITISELNSSSVVKNNLVTDNTMPQKEEAEKKSVIKVAKTEKLNTIDTKLCKLPNQNTLKTPTKQTTATKIPTSTLQQKTKPHGNHQRMLLKPKKNTNFGDGSELDSIEDLKYDKKGESRFMKSTLTFTKKVTGSGMNQKLNSSTPLRKESNRIGMPKNNFNSGQTSLTRSNVGGNSLRSTKIDDASNCRSRTDIYNHNLKSNSSFALSNSRRPVNQNHFSTQINKKKSRKQPTLIRNMNPANSVKVVGEMVYNPILKTWEGNDKVLLEFENNLQPSNKNLIKPTKNFQHQQGEMTFDPIKMKWIGNEAEADNIFDGLEDLNDDKIMFSKDGKLLKSSELSSEFDIGIKFKEALFLSEVQHKLAMGKWYPKAVTEARTGFRDASKSYLYEIRNIY
ncbi:hypothetical protein HK099_005370 [Clydaea vesicula]|uniref:Uncharacterized protein n=1 Tax=Clydaea vesicula TaxID=447962 RepID=A0AAD5U3Y1_9FUNG|nr:hypothetical protein HK099_005370 [Clydaea vesicula]